MKKTRKKLVKSDKHNASRKKMTLDDSYRLGFQLVNDSRRYKAR